MDLGDLYNQLLVRDAIGKLAPGAIVTLALFLCFAEDPKTLLPYVKEMSWVAWLPLLAVAYLVGLGVQGLIFETFENPLFRYHNLPSPEAFTERMHSFYLALSNEPERAAAKDAQQRERFAALKEATANGAAALVIAAILLGTRLLIASRTLHVGAGLLIAGACVLGLLFFHPTLRDLQDEFERTVIKKSAEGRDGQESSGGSPEREKQ